MQILCSNFKIDVVILTFCDFIFCTFYQSDDYTFKRRFINVTVNSSAYLIYIPRIWTAPPHSHWHKTCGNNYGIHPHTPSDRHYLHTPGTGTSDFYTKSSFLPPVNKFFKALTIYINVQHMYIVAWHSTLIFSSRATGTCICSWNNKKYIRYIKNTIWYI